MRRMSARGRLGVVLAAAVLLSAGCTGGDGSAQPAADRTRAPADASPTPSQVDLALGEAASLRMSGRGGRSSRVRLAVTEVVEGRVNDLAKFRLSPRIRRSTPYYATVQVTNRGRGDLSGRRLTLWALDSDGTVHPPADVIGSFRRCPGSPLPQRFRRGDTARTCLLYLLPRGTTLEAVQYRFSDRPPFSWPPG